MLMHFWVVSYDGETMGYDSLVQDCSNIAKEIFDYVDIFYKSNENKATIQVTEYRLPKKYKFETEDDFFNSIKWNDGSFEDGVIVSTHSTNLKK